MVVDAGDARCRASAFHETSHIVVAAAEGLPISSKGMSINSFGGGTAWFKGATDGSHVEPEMVDAVVVAMMAGGIAHRRIQNDVGDALVGDEYRINELLEKSEPDAEKRQAKYVELKARSEKLVSDSWEKIEDVAESLWGQVWKPRHPNRALPKDKHMSGSEIKAALQPIEVIIRDDFE